MNTSYTIEIYVHEGQAKSKFHIYLEFEKWEFYNETLREYCQDFQRDLSSVAFAFRNGVCLITTNEGQ